MLRHLKRAGQIPADSLEVRMKQALSRIVFIAVVCISASALMPVRADEPSVTVGYQPVVATGLAAKPPFTTTQDPANPRRPHHQVQRTDCRRPPERPGLKAIHLWVRMLNPETVGDYPVAIEFADARHAVRDDGSHRPDHAETDSERCRVQ